MIREAYCSYEVAQLLKEKGFNEKTTTYYEGEQVQIICKGDWFEWNNSPLGQISAPTHQMATAWLRKEGIYVEIEITMTTTDKVYYHSNVGTLNNNWITVEDWLEDYEEAVEKALKYSLEKLI